MEVKMIDVDKIRPNPFQPREAFPKEEIQQLANTIRTKEIGLLQPISVRREGDTYRIISGERRWRASQFAGSKKIPAIVKDITDSQLMMQSFIENAHRKGLESMEQARGLAEVYRLVGLSPTKVAEVLNNRLKWIPERFKLSDLSTEEQKIKEIADMVSLSYDQQYRILSRLRLTPEEQKRVSELELGGKKISSISTIEEPEIRKRVIEIAPELTEEEVKKMSKVVKKAPEHVKEAILKKESKITPEIAEEIMKLEDESAQKEIIKQVETLRLDEEETRELVELHEVRTETPKISSEKLEEVRKDYEKLMGDIREKLETPEVKERGKLFRNWLAHYTMTASLPEVRCPICGANPENLRWTCHNLTIKEASDKGLEIYQKSIRREEK